MKLKLKKIAYPILVSLIVLLPNLFVMAMGIESFPYTCAPMFGHYINDRTSLFILNFEGVSEQESIDLTEYYGKSELYFVRHFFSKVYGSTETISPYSHRLLESQGDFYLRMNQFFFEYNYFLNKKYNLVLEKIYVKAKKVDKNRNELSVSDTLGYYSIEDRKYYSLFEDDINNILN